MMLLLLSLGHTLAVNAAAPDILSSTRLRTRFLVFQRHGQSVYNQAVEPAHKTGIWRAPFGGKNGRWFGNTAEHRGERWLDANLSRVGREQAQRVCDNYESIKEGIDQAYMDVVGQELDWKRNVLFRVSPMTRAIETAVRGFVGAFSQRIPSFAQRYFAIDRNVWETAFRLPGLPCVNCSYWMPGQDHAYFQTMDTQLTSLKERLDRTDDTRVDFGDAVGQQRSLSQLADEQSASQLAQAVGWDVSQDTGDRPQQFLRNLFEEFQEHEAAFYIGHSKFFKEVMEILIKQLPGEAEHTAADTKYCKFLRNTEIVALAVQEVEIIHFGGRREICYLLRRMFDDNTRGTRAIYTPPSE